MDPMGRQLDATTPEEPLFSEKASNYKEERDLEITDPLIDRKAVGFRSTKVRWVALALGCLAGVGNFFCFDNPQALQDILGRELHISDTQFNLLYSVYSFPNIILPFFGGMMLDKMGLRLSLGIFTVLLIIAQSIITFGAMNKSFATMIVGRVIFGLGGECLNVAQSSVIAKWFMGKELSFALGIVLCVGRMGSSLNSFMSPKIYEWTNNTLYAPFAVGAVITVISFICALSLGSLDKKADEQEGVTKEQGGEPEKIHLKDLKNFKPIYYLLLFNCFFLYGAFFGLNNNLNAIMTRRFGFTPNTAGNFIPIVYICSAIITPMFGMFTDKKGKRVLFMLIASFLFLGDHIAIAFLKDTTPEGHPNYGMVAVLLFIGLFYATYAAIFWPCVPLVVPEKMIGTAYGIVTALQNVMLATIPLILGTIHDKTENIHAGYFWTEILLAGIVGCGIIVTMFIYVLDIRTGGRLNKPGTQREKESGQKSSIRSFTKN